MKRPEPLVFGRSEGMVRALRLCDRFASGSFPVLIMGERGTGKTELARYIHQRSGRAGAFVDDSGAAHSDGLELGALLGHRRGSFTGAIDDRPGLIESAQGGTLFIDELDSASSRMQAFLLKVLDTRTVRRIGEVRDRELDVRFIAATNADLASLIAAGGFRQDLLDRFGYFILHLPPLAQRQDEIHPLSERFLHETSVALGISSTPRLAPEVLMSFHHAPWKGNVRELRFLCEYLAVTCSEKEWIEVSDLPLQFLETHTLSDRSEAHGDDRIRRAVDAAGGNREAAAKALGITTRHLYRILSRSRSQVSRNSA
jgi:DNA-binding NtrC family response regulator